MIIRRTHQAGRVSIWKMCWSLCQVRYWEHWWSMIHWMSRQNERSNINCSQFTTLPVVIETEFWDCHGSCCSIKYTNEYLYWLWHNGGNINYSQLWRSAKWALRAPRVLLRYGHFGHCMLGALPHSYRLWL